MGMVTTHAGTAGVVNAVAELRPWVSSRAWSGPHDFGLAMAGPRPLLWVGVCELLAGLCAAKPMS
jgi:hypothetical protein